MEIDDLLAFFLRILVDDLLDAGYGVRKRNITGFSKLLVASDNRQLYQSAALDCLGLRLADRCNTKRLQVCHLEICTLFLGPLLVPLFQIIFASFNFFWLLATVIGEASLSHHLELIVAFG